MNWFDLVSMRDSINLSCYGKLPREPLMISVAAGVAFLIILQAVQIASPTLLIQFVCGAILLHLLTKVLKQFSPKPKLLEKQGIELIASQDPIIMELDRSRWALLVGYFELRSSFRKDIPIQQNALLALTLIAFQSGYFYDASRAKWIATETILLFLFMLVRKWEETQNQSLAWLRASDAVKLVLTKAQ